MKDFNLMLGQLVIGYAVLEAIGFLAAMLALYYVIRTAVRDGINDSRMVSRQRFAEPMADAHPPPAARAGADTLPDMRADR